MEVNGFEEIYFGKLKTFDKLHSLVIQCFSNIDLNASFTWPPNIKHLRLSGFTTTFENFISTINKLKNTENINLWGCFVGFYYHDQHYSHDHHHFKDLKTLSHQILNVIKQKKLTVVLPKCHFMHKNRSKVMADL